MNNGWERVWPAIDARRIELGMSLNDLYRATKVSEKTFRDLRTKSQPIAAPQKRAMICKALDWTSDSIDRIVQGGTPVIARRLPLPPLPQELHEIEMAATAVMVAISDVKDGAPSSRLTQARTRFDALRAGFLAKGIEVPTLEEVTQSIIDNAEWDGEIHIVKSDGQVGRAVAQAEAERAARARATGNSDRRLDALEAKVDRLTDLVVKALGIDVATISEQFASAAREGVELNPMSGEELVDRRPEPDPEDGDFLEG